jgi:hemoglobin/transferrin/lactoferrin receptor protein
MSGSNHKNRIRNVAALLLCSTAALAAMPGCPGLAHAQASSSEQAYQFDIPAKPLASALADVGKVSGWRIAYAFDLSGTSAPLSGSMTPQQAVSRLLAGTDVSYRVSGPRSIVLQDRVSAAHATPAAGTPPPDGSTVLNTINIQGGGASTVYTPFETAAAASHIPAERIERFRGSSPADIFRGTPGVLSGEAHNGAGSVDVNIRGMQGMGRVQVSVDGAENALQISQGYQGISNRTFLDPDLIAGVDVIRGADVSSRGIAGSVALRTLSADDIVRPGDTWGVRVKGGFGTNTSKPEQGAVGGYAWPIVPWLEPKVPVASDQGLDRPGLLQPSSGSGSIVAATKNENYDLLAGYAYRKQGNYHAGRNGPAASPVNLGPRPYCYSGGICDDRSWENYYQNEGITNYRPGEEVLNTQLETQSWLAKATLHLENEQTLHLGYTGFRSEGGDLLASLLSTERIQPVQQRLTTGVGLDTGTLRYRWQPADNELIDLTVNGWVSHLRQRYAPRDQGKNKPEDLGLPTDFRAGSDSLLWGGDVANTSRFDLAGYGSLDLSYGLSYTAEDTSPTKHALVMVPGQGSRGSVIRDAARQEAGAYARLAYKPLDWLTVNAGMRYSHYWSDDRKVPIIDYGASRKRNDGGFTPSVGLTLEPLRGVQLYANYASAMRMPSIVEAGGTFVVPTGNLSPERNNSWDVGANFTTDGLLSSGDSAMLKLGYFNWDVKDYISREYGTLGGTQNVGMYVHNIDRAKFSGIELTGRYENGGFTAELNANYYLGVDFCYAAGTCANATLYGDYATNQVPPEYSVDLSLSQKLFDDRLTLGGRMLHVGPRAAGHGQVTTTGAMQFISLVSWKPYTLVDVFAEYKVSDSLTATVRVENLTDQYYVDPLSLVRQPGPGRTFYAGLTGTFGGNQTLPHFSAPFIRDLKGGKVDWTGAYAGFHFGTGVGRTWGNTTSLDGTATDVAATESADLNLNGMNFGVQAGYNWQFGNGLVLGAEAGWTKSYLNGAQGAATTESWTSSVGLPGEGLQANTHYDIDWTAALRGRVGYAFDNRWMIYGSGGVAFAKETQWRDQFAIQEVMQDTTDVVFVEKDSATRIGYTFGGGAEYALNERWSINADYSYSGFSRKGFRFDKARAGVTRDYVTQEVIGKEWRENPNREIFGDAMCDMIPGFCDPFEADVYGPVHHQGSPTTGRRASNALDFHTFRIGLNYRF